MRNFLSGMQKVFNKPLIIVGGITILGAFLRLYHLGYKPLWLDEAFFYWLSYSNTVQGVITQSAVTVNTPPLFLLLLHFIMKIGDSEVILRLLPCLGGIASIPAMYFLSRQFIDRYPAYLTALIVAIAPTQIEFSQQVREYSLTFFISIVILTLFFMQVHNPSRKNWVLMTLSMVIGVFLQYGLALMIIALNLVCAIMILSNKHNRKSLLIRWSLAQFIVLSAVIVLYYVSLNKQFRVGLGATATSSFLSGDYWNGSFRSLFGFVVSNTHNIFDFTFPGYVFLFLGLIGFIFVMLKKNVIAIMMFASPIILTFILSLTKLYPYNGDRHDMFLTPMIYVLVGFGISYLLNLEHLRWFVLPLLLWIIYIGFKSDFDYLKYPGVENIRPVITALSRDFETGDKIYVYYSAKPAFTYYYRDNIESQIYGISSRRDPNKYYQEIDKLLLSYNRIWLVFSHCYANECELIPKHVSEKHRVDLIASDNGTWLYIVH
jgi:uncharacterized membrane protein